MSNAKEVRYDACAAMRDRISAPYAPRMLGAGTPGSGRLRSATLHHQPARGPLQDEAAEHEQQDYPRKLHPDEVRGSPTGRLSRDKVYRALAGSGDRRGVG